MSVIGFAVALLVALMYQWLFTSFARFVFMCRDQGAIIKWLKARAEREMMRHPINGENENE